MTLEPTLAHGCSSAAVVASLRAEGWMITGLLGPGNRKKREKMEPSLEQPQLKEARFIRPQSLIRRPQNSSKVTQLNAQSANQSICCMFQ